MKAPLPSKVPVYKGMQLYLMKNVRKEDDFVNGMLCTVESYHPREDVLCVLTKTGHRLVVTRWTDPDKSNAVYFPIRLGFASTIHKVQGDEFAHITIYIPGCARHAGGWLHGPQSRGHVRLLPLGRPRDAGASGACHVKLFRKGRARFEGWQLFLKKRFWTARVVCRSSFTFARKSARTARRAQHILWFALGRGPTRRALCLGAKKRSGRTTTVQVASREKKRWLSSFSRVRRLQMDRFAFAGKKARDAGISGACHAKLFRRGRSSFIPLREKALTPHDEYSIFYGSPWGDALRSERFALARGCFARKNASSVPFRASGGSPDVCLAVRNESFP